MTILAGDIKLVASQVMDDIETGGGAPTASIIQDGTSNSIFNDISELDRAGGRVNLRKLFASIQTLNTDNYLGANVIVADTPDDPNVSVTIFEASNTFDRRSDARNRIETYLNKSAALDGFLFENHVAGQRAIQIFHRENVKPPVPGRTLYLVMNEGLGSEFSQYIRVTDVKTESRVFSYLSGTNYLDYTASVSTLSLSDALKYDFPGSPNTRDFTKSTGKTTIRDTLVADAAQYYGASKLTASATIGDVSAHVESIFTKLVPSTQSETAMVDQYLTSLVNAQVPAASSQATRSVSVSISANSTYHLPTACYPGSFELTANGKTLTDDGAGNVLYTGIVVGTVNYQTGVISTNASFPSGVSGVATEKYITAVVAPMRAYSQMCQVTQQNRSYVWVVPLAPIPSPGTVSVSYMVQGNWYELRDDGAGKLGGSDASYGVGTVNYTTGTINATLGALPDADTDIIISWGTKQEYLILADTGQAIPTPGIAIETGTLLKPSSLSFSWTAGGVAKTATDNGSGALTGAATGSVLYGSGSVVLSPTDLPDHVNITTNVQSGGGPETYGVATADQVSWSGTLPNAPIKAKSLVLELSTITKWSSPGQNGVLQNGFSVVGATVRDNGSGGLILDGYGLLPGSSVNYTTGAVVLAINIAGSGPVATYNYVPKVLNMPAAGETAVFAGYVNSTTARTIAAGGIAAKYQLASTADSADSASLAFSEITVDLTPLIKGTIIPGSLRFSLGGFDYVDRSGMLYHSINPADGSGAPAGTVNYATGKLSITAWTTGAATFTLKSCLINPGTPGMAYAVGRTASSPVKSQSFAVSATALDGTTISATANAAGVISGTNVTGAVNYEKGTFAIAFGHQDGANWIDKLVDPSTLKYNGVSYTYLPLDVDVIGIDPVRLPQDGRVPIFRPGNFAVIGHTAVVGPISPTNGQTVNCNRVRLSRVRVLNVNGAVIDTGYTADLEAGTVTFTDVSGMLLPVTVEHRIEDMAQVSDVQISGQLAFTRQLSHDFPSGSVVSSALIAGDLHAKVTAMFDQASWAGTWTDVVSGSNATATFNDVIAPIELTNKGSITERWTIQFTNTTTFNVIGEHVGIVSTGNTSTDLAPVNPATGQPYFTLRAIGWGSGWSAGNVLRFNTSGPVFPVWVVRTIQQGLETVTSDSFTLLVRGDVDHP